MTNKQHNDIYIASYDKNGGIYRYRLFADGKVQYVDFTAIDRPMYMVKSNGKLYVLLREPFKNSKESGLVTYDTGENGELTDPSEIISTQGEAACHLCVDGRRCYCANYISGSVIKMPDRLIVHSGNGIDTVRQSSPHPHFAGMTPDKKYICVADLGLDSIFLYDIDLDFVSKASVPAGHGARHLAFSKNYLYCANELRSTLSVFELHGGSAEYITTIPILPDNFKGESTASAIRVSGDFCYVANRGHDSISVIDISKKEPVFINTVSCHGKSPRDFNIVGDILICANEKSGNVSLFKMIDGEPQKINTELKIKSPFCIAY